MSEENNNNDGLWEGFLEVAKDLGYVADRFPKPFDQIIDLGNTIIDLVKGEPVEGVPQWKVTVANIAGGTASGVVATSGMSATVTAAAAAGGATPGGFVVFYQGTYVTFKAADDTNDIVENYTLDYLMSEGFIKREEELGDALLDARNYLVDKYETLKDGINNIIGDGIDADSVHSCTVFDDGSLEVKLKDGSTLNSEQKKQIANHYARNYNISGDSHLIQSGDTLSTISLKSGVSVEKLLELNPQITDPNLIIAGEELVLRKAQNSSEVIIEDESYEISNGDKLILLVNSGMVATDAVYVDSEGNPISVESAFFTTTDSEGNTVTILKEGVKSQAKDGSSYEVSSLVNQVESGLEKATKFMVDSTVQFTSDFQDYLVEHQGEIVGDFVARIILGESA